MHSMVSNTKYTQREKQMLSCEALEELQSDLKELSKLNCLPFRKCYKLAPGADLEELDEKDKFRVAIDSSSGPLIAKIEGVRKVPAILVGLICEKLAEILVARNIDQCDTMKHGGADELLSLYNCVRAYQLAPQLPYSTVTKGLKREYKIFSVAEDSSHFRLELITNHIYGDSTKSIADVEYEALIPEHCHEMLKRMLSEWIRPESVKSVKFALADLELSTTLKD